MLPNPSFFRFCLWRWKTQLESDRLTNKLREIKGAQMCTQKLNWIIFGRGCTWHFSVNGNALSLNTFVFPADSWWLSFIHQGAEELYGKQLASTPHCTLHEESQTKASSWSAIPPEDFGIFLSLMMSDNDLFEGLHFFYSEGEVCYKGAEMHRGSYSELRSQQVI